MKTVLMAMEQFNNADLNSESNILVRLTFGRVDHKQIYLGFVSALSSLFPFAPLSAPEAFPMPFASVSPLLLQARVLVTNTLL